MPTRDSFDGNQIKEGLLMMIEPRNFHIIKCLKWKIQAQYRAGVMEQVLKDGHVR